MSPNYLVERGIHLEKTSITTQELQHLIENFPNNVILRVFGFAGTGKGTLSASLANTLKVPNIESSLIWRGITLVYEELGLELNDQNSNLILGKIQVIPGDKKELLIKYNDKIVDRSLLKSVLVDSKVSQYAANSYLREKFYDIMIEYLRSIKSSCVLDGRGAYPRYIIGAAQSGYKIIRLLLDASEEEMAHRYYSAYLAKKQKEDPGHIETEVEKVQMLEDFRQGIIARNAKDMDTWEKLNLGLVTDDTAVIDTTGMSIEEVNQTALSFIKKELGL